MGCVCRHLVRSSRSYLSSLCAVVGRGGEQLLAFLLHVAGVGFGEGVGPRMGDAIGWGRGNPQMGCHWMGSGKPPDGIPLDGVGESLSPQEKEKKMVSLVV